MPKVIFLCAEPKTYGVTIGISNTYETQVNRHLVISAENEPTLLLKLDALVDSLAKLPTAEKYVNEITNHASRYDELLEEKKANKQMRDALNAERAVLKKKLEAKWKTKKDLVKYRIRNGY